MSLDINSWKFATTISNYSLIVLPFLMAFAGLLKFYSESVIEKELKERVSKPQLIQKGQLITVNSDKSIIIKKIFPIISIKGVLQVKEETSFDKIVANWIIDGVRLGDYVKKIWNESAKDFSKSSGLLNHGTLEGTVGDSTATFKITGLGYELRSYFLLGHTSLLPSSGETINVSKSEVYRVFNSNDLFNINENKFRKYNNFQDIPNQATMLYMEIEPEIIMKF